MQLKEIGFEESDHVSIFSFAALNRDACESIEIHGEVRMWLLREFVKSPVSPSIAARISPLKLKWTGLRDGRPPSCLEVLIVLAIYATNDVFHQAVKPSESFRQGSGVLPPDCNENLFTRVLRFGTLCEEKRVEPSCFQRLWKVNIEQSFLYCRRDTSHSLSKCIVAVHFHFGWWLNQDILNTRRKQPTYPKRTEIIKESRNAAQVEELATSVQTRSTIWGLLYSPCGTCM